MNNNGCMWDNPILHDDTKNFNGVLVSQIIFSVAKYSSWVFLFEYVQFNN